MTTLEPGASVVLTHGLRDSPLSTAFFASSAAPIITDGFEVLVHDVMAAITTCPWSTSNSWPSSETRAGFDGRPSAACAGAPCGAPEAPLPLPTAGESLAGNDSADPSSTVDRTPSPSPAYAPSASR